MRVLITIMYDGTAYCGWQTQREQDSIQGRLSGAIKELTGESVSVAGSGRTDAGVHALGQTAHFDLAKDFDIEKIVAGINFYLPRDIRVIEAKKVGDSFHARFDCKKKVYVYKTYIARVDNPLLRDRALRVESLDVPAMKAAAELLKGTHDFRAFCSSGSDVSSTIRTVYFCKASRKGDDIVFEVAANGFLYNMVRKIVAALISVGGGKRTAADIAALLKAPTAIKDIAPPYGLYLKKVYY